ncbi:hypothetical protein GCM10018953_15860 [Streptosporangium nondiastaticum]
MPGGQELDGGWSATADGLVGGAAFAVAAASGALDGTRVGAVASFGVAVAGPSNVMDGSGPEVVVGFRGKPPDR